jgi:exodeoxyribonuclease VII large subunit
MTPSQLNKLIEQTLKAGLPSTVLVRGEISNFTRNRNSGHLYFTLKDNAGAVDCVMWASRAERLKFEPRDGMELLATGGVGVYVPRGRYQIVVNSLDPFGEGALELAKRQLEAKLREEGLLDDERKRPIPLYPRTIAIVTSPQAAGFADVLKVLRRCGWVRLLIFPVAVQGKDAAPSIAAALKKLGSSHRDLGGVELVILTRGGGSLEDLWAFNDEAVARAMSACPIPIITGIGHDIDVSIADLVADHHAHTPTEAATYAMREWIHVPENLDVIRSRMFRESRRRVTEALSAISAIARHEVFRRPGALIEGHRQRLDDLEGELTANLEHRRSRATARLERIAGALSPSLARRLLSREVERIENAARTFDHYSRANVAKQTARLHGLDAQLRALAPQNVLKRGYSITRIKKTGRPLTSSSQVKGGELLETHLAEGVVESRATDPKQAELF